MNKIRFEVGYKTGCAGLYGGWLDMEVVSRTESTVIFRESWVGEDTGKLCYTNASYAVEVEDLRGTEIERVKVWEYRDGSRGYVYAAGEDVIDEIIEAADIAEAESCEDGRVYEVRYSELARNGEWVDHVETFQGTDEELNGYLDELRLYYSCVKAELKYDPDWDRDIDDYIPSATAGDYSPSNPWDAPGMSVSDFISGVCPF